MTEYGKSLLTVVENTFPKSNSKLSINQQKIKKWCIEWINVLEQVMPDHYDIQYHYFVNSKENPTGIAGNENQFAINEPVVVLHFPKFNITDNTYKHTITDMYVYLPINASWMYGKRGSFTLQEIQASYAHSHLASNIGDNEAKSFCLGTGTIRDTLVQYLDISKIDLKDNNEENYKFLVFEILAYLKWQSNEGGPYRFIHTIQKNVISTINRKNYANYELSTFLTEDDIDYSNPTELKLKDDILVKDHPPEDYNKLITSRINSLGRTITFRGVNKPIEITIDKLPTHKNNLRPLTNEEKQDINQTIKNVYETTIKNDYVIKEVQSDFIR